MPFQPSANTTEAVRRAIQSSPESMRALAKRYGVNQKTVAKWRGRTSTRNLRCGPKGGRSRALTTDEEKMAVSFRLQTRLPLDDCLFALQASIPHLTRSTLHRCFQRRGIGRLPDTDFPTLKRSGFAALGHFDITVAEVDIAEAKVFLYAAIDRASKLCCAQTAARASGGSACAFLRALVAATPYSVLAIHTDNTIQFAAKQACADRPNGGFGTKTFEQQCRRSGIQHVRAKPKNRRAGATEAAAVGALDDIPLAKASFESREQLDAFVSRTIQAFRFHRRLKSLGGLTPEEFISRNRAAGAPVRQGAPKDPAQGPPKRRGNSRA